jgi:hypothetical protein
VFCGGGGSSGRESGGPPGWPASSSRPGLHALA